MRRRSLLTWIGASAAGSVLPLSAASSQSQKKTGVISLESFGGTNSAQMPSMHDYFANTFVPVLRGIHNRPKIFLEAIVAPQTPQVLFVSAFPSFDEMLDTRNKLAAHPDIQRARAGFQAHVQSQVLVGGPDDLQFPADFKSLSMGIIELRSFFATANLSREDVNAIFRRAGMKPILNASATAGEHLPQLSCLVPFKDFGVREEAWARFESDPQWIKMQARATGTSIFKLAPYSTVA